MKTLGWFLIGVCLIAAVGCGRSNSTTDHASSYRQQVENSAPHITIAAMSFGDPVTVPAGAQVTVTNNDTVEHSVTSDTNGLFDVHVDGNQEKNFTAPNQPGQYPFHCVYHTGMKGALLVR
jgi:plastocyanin